MRHGAGFGWTLLLAMALGLSGCQGADDRSPEPMPVEQEAPSGGMGAPPGAPLRKMADQSAPASEPAPQATEARHIIRRAEVSLLVTSVPRAVEEVRSLAKAKGGYVSDESLDTSSGQVPSGSLTLRVPLARFDETLQSFGEIGEIQSRRLSAEDVTLEYVDTESRLRNLQREEAQFLKILQRAGSIRDVLAVEKELARVRGEIEQTTGRLRQLSNLVDLATIAVNLSARAEEAVTSPWDLAPVVRNAWQDAQAELAAASARVVSGLIWVGAYLVPLAIPIVLVYLVLGWLLARLLMGRWPWLTATRFRMAWSLVGVAVLVIAFPPLLLFLLAVAVLAFGASKIPAIRSRWGKGNEQP